MPHGKLLKSELPDGSHCPPRHVISNNRYQWALGGGRGKAAVSARRETEMAQVYLISKKASRIRGVCVIFGCTVCICQIALRVNTK